MKQAAAGTIAAAIWLTFWWSMIAVSSWDAAWFMHLHETDGAIRWATWLWFVVGGALVGCCVASEA